MYHAHHLMFAITMFLFLCALMVTLNLACLNTYATDILLCETFMIHFRPHHHCSNCCLRMSKHSEFGKEKRKNRGKRTTIEKMDYKVVKFLVLSFVSSTLFCMIVFIFSVCMCGMNKHSLNFDL